MDITVHVNPETGDGFDPIDVSSLGVSGKDGDRQPTPTVRELIAILSALPEQFQDLPVTRYCNDGVAGINYELHYQREHDPDNWTAHVSMW